jgi:hypothetical protein
MVPSGTLPAVISLTVAVMLEEPLIIKASGLAVSVILLGAPISSPEPPSTLTAVGGGRSLPPLSLPPPPHADIAIKISNNKYRFINTPSLNAQLQKLDFLDCQNLIILFLLAFSHNTDGK